jgi:adenine-specific DNA-methyltransferase
MRTAKWPLPDALRRRCRELRTNATDAEGLLWHLLRNRHVNSAKFRRQHPVGRYILDFYCVEAKLAIELDGGQHSEAAQERKDAARTRALAEQGVNVLRFWNHEVLAETEAVLETIWYALTPALLTAGG